MNQIPMPSYLFDRPRDIRGLPITYVTYIPSTYPQDKRIDFRITDPLTRLNAIQSKLCGICGKPLLGDIFYFIGGPLCHESRVFSDPAMHGVCARYSIRVCPFLYTKSYRVGDAPVDTIKDAMAIAERPEKMGLFHSPGFEPAKVRNGVTGLVHPMVYAYSQPFLYIEWF